MVGPPHVPTLFGVFLWPKTVRCVLAVIYICIHVDIDIDVCVYYLYIYTSMLGYYAYVTYTYTYTSARISTSTYTYTYTYTYTFATIYIYIYGCARIHVYMYVYVFYIFLFASVFTLGDSRAGLRVQDDPQNRAKSLPPRQALPQRASTRLGTAEMLLSLLIASLCITFPSSLGHEGLVKG